MSARGGNAEENGEESAQTGERDGTGRVGGLVGIAGAVAIAVGLVTIQEIPGPDAGATQVYAFFLDETGGVARPTALIAVGLLCVLVLFSTIRGLSGGRRSGG